MSAHEEMTRRSEELDTAFYALLDTCDDYRNTIDALLAAEEESGAPREQLVHRLKQMRKRLAHVTTLLEDDVLSGLVPMFDRLFTIERAEQGIDI